MEYTVIRTDKENAVSRFDSEIIKENAEAIKENISDLELDYDEYNAKQNAEKERRTKIEKGIIAKTKYGKIFPDNSSEETRCVTWAVEYTNIITCPGCGEKINTEWVTFCADDRCPFCSQKMDVEVYIT